jgi:4-diphosphocytidyl-2-C-methyl-D-erythritol kinase
VRTVEIEAPAKVNLCLHILGRRADGYHELDTLMQTVSLFDTLSITPRDDGELRMAVSGRSEGVPDDERNLVVKAALLLRERLGPRGADIHLVKRVPHGAGLGGGSSDAAAALVGLCEAWGAHFEESELLRICAALGSDVPFFLRGGTVRCTGRGEVLERLDAIGVLHLVLAFSSPLPTKDVYDRYRRQNNILSTCAVPRDTISRTENGGVDLSRFGAYCSHNALEEAAMAIRPSLARVRSALVDAGVADVRMSGSGSCFFGVADSAASASVIAGELRSAGHEVAAVESVGACRLGV